MSWAREIELAQADVCSCRDRLALLRARLYRWGVRPGPRLRELEGELERSERRLRDVLAGPRGDDRNRTGVDGFAGRCVATPPRRRESEA